MIYVGIDYSITSPAMVIIDGAIIHAYAFGDKKKQGVYKFMGSGIWEVRIDPYPVYSSEQERYDKIANYFIEKIERLGENIQVRIENYSYASVGQVFHIAENCGLLKHYLWKKEIPFDVIAPPTIKKYATGSGRANKDAMYEAMCNDLSCDFRMHVGDDGKKVSSPTPDIVDAYYIAKSIKDGVVSLVGKK